MDKISPELAERMVDAIRYYFEPLPAQEDFRRRTGKSVYAEMVDIAKNLPKPVDPDLIEAREIVAMCCLWFTSEDAAEMAKRIRAGAWDDGRSKLVQFTLSALKRGRELAGGAA